MRRYLVVAHKTLGGAHLLDELHRLREDDPYCTFHLIVPEHRADHSGWEDESDGERAAQSTLDEMLDRLAAVRIGATGEVGDANPVSAVGDTLRRERGTTFAGIILSTLPKGISRWWLFDVPKRMAAAYPHIPLTHLVGRESFAR